MDTSNSEHLDESSTKRKPRKRVSKKKLVKKPKRRGEYKPKVIGVGDTDMAECIFSDEETRADFLEFHVPNVLEATSGCADLMLESEETANKSELTSLASDRGNRSTVTPTLSDSVESTSESCSTPSRPDSAASSRPSSASSSRPGSSLGSVHFPHEMDSSVTSEVVGEDLEQKMQQLSHPPSASPTSGQNLGVERLEENVPPLQVIEAGILRLKSVLLARWFPVADKAGIHLLFLSDSAPKCIQREIFITYGGDESVYVHCVPLTLSILKLSPSPLSNLTFDESSLETFVERSLYLVRKLMQFEVCVGANNQDARSVWSTIPDTYIDINPYREVKYVETCRSLSCSRLVELGKSKRCGQCAKVARVLGQRKNVQSMGTPHPNTPNVFLSHEQVLDKLQMQHEEIRKRDKIIAYQRKRIEQLLQVEGVDIDNGLSEDFSVILSKANLSDVQRMFLEEQFNSARKSDARSHRWHPSMIRLALHIKMVSTSAYEALRDSGVVRLPSSRTLFDYSHAIAAKEGINEGIVKHIHDNVSKLEKSCQKFHVLLCDEMHVSKNLVYRQSDGNLVGYMHLDEVEKEVATFEKFIAGDKEMAGPSLANKVLAFMVKGLTSDVKGVVAVYPVNTLTADMLYTRAWSVINVLEKAGIKILALTCDGSAVNRSFISMHTPLTKTKSGVVFDTINFCSPDERPLFFIADVCHLLKTIRNCFYNSGEEDKKPRCLRYKNELIIWKHIVRLYLQYKGHNFRKSYKLNAQNVFPNSFSCMKVCFAAQVLSATVANDIEQKNWPNTTQTVKFIRKCNKFFDCLNGAHSKQSTRKRNPDLAPYTDENDPRFKWLQEKFLDYLDDWKKQSEALPLTPVEKQKTMLSSQTIQGIEIAIKGFTGATRYLLNPQKGAAKFVMARAFSQDPLERNFSMMRAGFGGSRNPNVSQVLQKEISVTVQRDLGVRMRKSNVKGGKSGMDLTDEPLPKRCRKSNP